MKQIDHDLTLEPYFKLVAPLVEKVKCSHTRIRLPAKYQQAVYEYGNYLPLKLLCKDHKAYIVTSITGSDTGIPPGSEVLSINNVPVGIIIDQLLSLVPSEGACLTTKYNEINQNFHSYFYLLDHSETFEA